MKVIIIGFGRMGQALAHKLIEKKAEVVVTDSNPHVFEPLQKDTKIKTIVGLGFDKDILESTGIQQADAVVACTTSDESNAVIARVAKNYYRVRQAIARLYDPSKAEIYNMLGVQTISTTDWGIKRAMKLLEYSQMDSLLTLGDGDIEVLKVEVPPLLVGKSIQTFGSISIRIVGMLRNNKAYIPSTGALLEANDVLYIAVEHNSIPQLRSILGL